ncbi:MAG: AtpZ/AtpI family protein [Alphaproteobacteria bacterium]|nr:AtpZ/AtpI family protein [Alphaproteobacteria bacterium]MCY4607786.1 AtpZ/AtpI family protein [bacterium]
MADDPSDLETRIAAARKKDKGGRSTGKAQASGYGMAVRMTVEMVAALAVSVFLGLWLDGELDTAPLFLVIFLVLGMAAGVINVVRAARVMTRGPRCGPADSEGDRKRGD